MKRSRYSEEQIVGILKEAGVTERMEELLEEERFCNIMNEETKRLH